MSSHFRVLKNQNNPSFFFLQTLYLTEWTGSDSKSDQTFRTLWLRCDPSAWGEQLTTTTRWITAAEQPRDVNNYWCISTEWVLVRNDRQQQVKCQHRPLWWRKSNITVLHHHMFTFIQPSHSHLFTHITDSWKLPKLANYTRNFWKEKEEEHQRSVCILSTNTFQHKAVSAG